MVISQKKYWDSFSGTYEEKVVSIFENQNKLVKELKNIDKKNKTVADLGCGNGKALPYLKHFKKIYLVDYSRNMLNKISSEKDITIINENSKKVKLPEKVDYILAINSVFPENDKEFEKHITNFSKNCKANGFIYLVLGSLEFRTFLYHLKKEYLIKNNYSLHHINEIIQKEISKENFNPFGYILQPNKTVQKQWLKEEIRFKIKKMGFEKIYISKLKVRWNKTQRKETYLKNYPLPWYWLVKIKNK